MTAWSVIPVSGREDLTRRQDSWRTALTASGAERLFLEPEWIVPWLETYGREPRAALLACDGQIRAAAILVANSLTPEGRGPTILRPPGLGVSDYLDLLLPSDPAEAGAAAAVLLDWLLEAGGWELLDLPNLPAESATAKPLMASARERGLLAWRVEAEARPFTTLGGDWETYFAARSSKLRKHLRAAHRQLAALGELRFCHYRSPEQVADRLKAAAAVHARRWRGQHTSTIFSASGRGRRFYAEATVRMAANGWVDLSGLELDGRLIAFALCFVYGNKCYYYLPAFDPQYSRFAPSTTLLAHLIETAFTRQLQEFDFMLGDEPYKRRWATGFRRTDRLVLAAPGWRGSAALAAFRAYLSARERARQSLFIQRARRYGLGRVEQALGR